MFLADSNMPVFALGSRMERIIQRILSIYHAHVIFTNITTDESECSYSIQVNEITDPITLVAQ
jgi:hypothetical protein